MWRRTRPTSGPLGPSRAASIAGLVALLGSGCVYTFQAGSGLPGHVETVAIVPFENETDRFEVSQELYDVLLEEIPRTFGVRTGGEEFAEALVRGTVRQYSVQAGSYRPDQAGGNQTQVIERSVRVTVEVQVIDLDNSLILWESAGLTATGEYLEATGTEEEGRRLALSRVVQDIVDGLQSNW